ncbi:reverse transcriptase domain-containing protein, partial [Tanacetum coccineum]
ILLCYFKQSQSLQSVSSDSEPGGESFRGDDEELSNDRFSRVIVIQYDGRPNASGSSNIRGYVPRIPEAPTPSPDLRTGHEHPPSPAEVAIRYLSLTRDTEVFEADETAPTPVPSPRRHTARISEGRDLLALTDSTHLHYHLWASPLLSDSAHHYYHLHHSSIQFPPYGDIPEAKLPPRKRLCPSAPTSRYEVGESSTTAPRPTGGHRADYVFIGTMDAEIRRRRAEEVKQAIDIRDCLGRPTVAVEDTQDRQTQLVQRVEDWSGRQVILKICTMLWDQEALVSREAWAHSIRLSSAVSSLQGQLSAALGQIHALQARDQTHVVNLEGAASTVVGLVFSFLVSNNHLIETRVAEAIANQEQLRNIGVNGDGSQNLRSGTERPTRTPRDCTFKDFLNCQPLTFKGTEGVVGLTQWLEKMESVFHISNCIVENQVKFATCTFFGNALTWWNSLMKTVTQDVSYAMDWKTLKKMMTGKYCPRGEIKKLEIELWNLKVKGTDVVSYTLHFQELVLMCGRMFYEESDEVEKYVVELPNLIRGNVMSYQPKTMEKAIEFANDQMDQKVLTIAERQAEQKRKLEFNARNN